MHWRFETLFKMCTNARLRLRLCPIRPLPPPRIQQGSRLIRPLPLPARRIRVTAVCGWLRVQSLAFVFSLARWCLFRISGTRGLTILASLQIRAERSRVKICLPCLLWAAPQPVAPVAGPATLHCRIKRITASYNLVRIMPRTRPLRLERWFIHFLQRNVSPRLRARLNGASPAI
jgi:hypothetical protein